MDSFDQKPNSSPPSPPDSERQTAFGERYGAVVVAAGVQAGVAVWYRRHVERFIGFLKPRRLKEAQPADVTAYLLRMHRQPDTEAWQERQVDHALRLLFQHFRERLPRALGELGEFERAKRPRRLPVVLTAEEMRRVLSQMSGMCRLMALLLYGAGLRLMECVRLRVQDVDFDRGRIAVRRGNGNRDRWVPLPDRVCGDLEARLVRLRRLHAEDPGGGSGPDVIAGSAGSEVSERRAGMDVAVFVDESRAVGGPAERAAATARCAGSSVAGRIVDEGGSAKPARQNERALLPFVETAPSS